MALATLLQFIHQHCMLNVVIFLVFCLTLYLIDYPEADFCKLAHPPRQSRSMGLPGGRRRGLRLRPRSVTVRPRPWPGLGLEHSLEKRRMGQGLRAAQVPFWGTDLGQGHRQVQEHRLGQGLGPERGLMPWPKSVHRLGLGLKSMAAMSLASFAAQSRAPRLVSRPVPCFPSPTTARWSRPAWPLPPVPASPSSSSSSTLALVGAAQDTLPTVSAELTSAALGPGASASPPFAGSAPRLPRPADTAESADDMVRMAGFADNMHSIKPTNGTTDLTTDEPTEGHTDPTTGERTVAQAVARTEEPIVEPIDEHTDELIERPTDLPTKGLIHGPTEVLTDGPTDASTDGPTSEPIDELTDRPNDKPTDVSTDGPTEWSSSDSQEELVCPHYLDVT